MKHYNEKKFEKKMETLSVEELNNFIMLRYLEKDEGIDDEIVGYLSERSYKLNETFEWTPENREKLLKLNEQYHIQWLLVRDEARELFQVLKKRSAENDCYFDSFEIEAKITANICIPNKEGEMHRVHDCVEEVVIEALHDERYHSFHHVSFSSEESLNDILYLDPEYNRNDHPQFKGYFDDDVISSSIYELFITCLSFQDILKINNLEVELQVKFNSSVEI